MANYRAVANGNWNTGSTWAGGSVPPNGQGHDVYSNTFTVTIDIDVNVNLITNAASAGTFVGGGTAAVGGGFSVTAGGFTITCPTITGPVSGTATCLTFSATTGTLTINGNLLPGSVNSTTNVVVNVNAGGSLVLNGNIVAASTYAQSALWGSSTSQITINGNITASPFPTNNQAAIPCGVFLSGQSSLTVNNGTISGSNANANNAAVINSGTGALTFNNCIINAGTAVSAITNSQTSATVTTVNCVHTATQNFACLSSSATLNRLSGTFVFGANGQIPVSASRYYLNTTPTNAYVQFALDGTNANSFVRYYTADNNLGQANPTDVRSGVSYASGNLTGRLTVPARGSVALSVNYGPSMPFTATRSGTTATATLAYSYPLVVGDQFTVTGASNSEWNGSYTIASVVSGTSVTFTVPNTHSASAGTGATMQTTGTAVLDPAAVATAVWGAATRTITGGLVDTATTLTNAPTVPSVVQIRQEMDSNSTKLANLDATVSSRLSPSGTLAVVTTLTNAPASVTPAQIRAEMDANSTKLANLDATISSRLAATDYNAPTSAPTAASVASAVWGAATRSITGGTVDTLTNAPSVPTPAQIASQVRTELATELARVDVATSTRLAGSAYTAPSNSDISAIKAKTDNLPASPAAVSDIPSANISAIKAKTDNLPASPAATGDIPSANISAIKAKTDLLNTDRLAQVSTVSTTGAQLAAALS